MSRPGRLRLRGGRVIDPAKSFDGRADLLIDEGRIVGYGVEIGGADGEAVVELAGLAIAPGFVDLHTHLREPGQEDKETIATGTRAAAAGGFTTVCAMPNTDPTIDTASDVAGVLSAARQDAVVRVVPLGSVTKRQRGEELSELVDLASAGAMGFSDDGHPVWNSRLMRHALEYSQLVARPVIDHCEDVELARGGVMHEGRVSAQLGLRGQPAAAEEIAVARNLALVRLTGGRLHLAHLSTLGSVELVRRAKNEALPVTTEVTPHHLTLTEELVAGQDGGFPFDPNTKVNPPLRSIADVEAVTAGLLDGTIDAIATDHAPHTLVDKQCEYDAAANGISGLETALALCLRLVHNRSMTLLQLVDRLTRRPASILKLEGGGLAPGAWADLVIFDPDERWTVDPARFLSKGRNTPLAGWILRGRVRATLVEGDLVYGELP